MEGVESTPGVFGSKYAYWWGGESIKRWWCGGLVGPGGVWRGVSNRPNQALAVLCVYHLLTHTRTHTHIFHYNKKIKKIKKHTREL